MLVYQRVNHTYHTETGWFCYFFGRYHPFWWTWLVLPSHVQVDQPTFPTWPHMGIPSIPIPYAPNVHSGKWPNGHHKWMVWRSKTDDRFLVTDPMIESYPNNKRVSSSLVTVDIAIAPASPSLEPYPYPHGFPHESIQIMDKKIGEWHPPTPPICGSAGGVSAGADPLHTMQLPVGGTWRDFCKCLGRWAVDVVMGCKTRANIGISIVMGEIRWSDMTSGDLMIADLEVWQHKVKKKSGGDFIRTREMPQEVWVTGQGGQTQQWVLHCSDGAYSNSSIGKYYGPLVLPKSPHRGWLSCREAGWNNRLGEPLDMLR